MKSPEHSTSYTYAYAYSILACRPAPHGGATSSDWQLEAMCNAATDQAQVDDETKMYVSGAMARLEAMFNEALKTSDVYRRDANARRRLAVKLLAGYFGLRVLVKAGAPTSTIKSGIASLLADI